MSQENSTTIQSYEQHLQDYINGTPAQASDVVKAWIDRSINGLPQDAAILELGSAFGRDAAYMQSKGHTVQCTDAVTGFVDHLNKSGFSARHFNAITDKLVGPYDLLFANAVLLHFTRSETEQVLVKIYNALKENGRFAFTVKQGHGESWSEAKINAPRYFCYWQADDLNALLTKIGFKSIDLVDQAMIENAYQIQVIAYK